MYFLLKQFFSKNISIICSSIYILTSYRAVDIYVRGALSEAFSFVFLPLIFLFILNIFKSQKRKDLVFLSLSFAGLILTHTLTALGFLPFIFFWIIFLIIKNKKIKPIVISLSALAIGVGVSCFAALPSILEKKFTLVDGLLLTELADYRIHFVYLRQLWSSVWGYGGSLPQLNDGLSFEIGKLLIICLLFVLAFSLISIYKTRKFPVFFVFPIFLLISVFMTVKYSKPLWIIFPPLAYLQFPWRFLTFVTFFTPFVFAIFVNFVSTINKKIVPLLLTFIFVISVLEVFGRFQPKELVNLNDSDYLTKQRLDWATSRSSFEYIPKGVKTKISPDNTTIPDIDPDSLPQTEASVLLGQAIIKEEVSQPGKQKYKITTKDSAVVQFSTFDFPGWKARVNGQSAEINSENSLKLITINVPSGDSEVELHFTRTPVRTISEIISLLSLLLLVLILLPIFNKNVINRRFN